ncbi:hypothetical protein BKA69DRAFT_1060592, partial [Paraphysoderma sedebokerense]
FVFYSFCFMLVLLPFLKLSGTWQWFLICYLWNSVIQQHTSIDLPTNSINSYEWSHDLSTVELYMQYISYISDFYLLSTSYTKFIFAEPEKCGSPD